MDFWVEVCRWDSVTITQNQTRFSRIMTPCSRRDTQIPYPFPDTSLTFCSLELVQDKMFLSDTLS